MEYEREIDHRKECRGKADSFAFHGFKRSVERRRPLAQRIGEGLSEALPEWRIRQPVQRIVHGIALGQKRVQDQSVHPLQRSQGTRHIGSGT